MSSPTLGFAVSEEDRPRLERLVKRHSRGNRSEWLRQAIDLFEQKDLFDTLARLQAEGDRQTASRGFDRESLYAAISETLESPSEAVVRRARQALEGIIGGPHDEAGTSSPDAVEAFFQETELHASQ